MSNYIQPRRSKAAREEHDFRFWLTLGLLAMGLLLALFAGLVACCDPKTLTAVVAWWDPRQTLSDEDAKLSFAQNLPARGHVLQYLHAEHAQSLYRDGNDITLVFSVAPEHVSEIKDAVLKYFREAYHPASDYKLDTTNDRALLEKYPGDETYKPVWWQPLTLADPDIVHVSDDWGSAIFIFSKKSGRVLYQIYTN
jgi:hypothetical protein